MTIVYVMDTSGITEGQIRENLYLLDENRQNKIRVLNDINERRLSFGTGFLVKRILEKHGLTKQNLFFTSDNKPYINDQLFISISHSGKYACVAESAHPVGIDLQENIGYLKSIEEKFFSDIEQQEIDGDIHKFYYVWCRKEAYIKVFGVKNLREIPLHLDNYFYLDFSLDFHYGSVLTQDKDFALKTVNFN